MNDQTIKFIQNKIAELEALNEGSTMDIEFEKMKLAEIERRMACNVGIIEGLKQVLEAAK